jgi:oxygen-independent coproporphyrinogen-3 oxidase
VEEAYGRAGLARYEVSNYAKPKLHSRHNALYWTGGEYLALGVGATGRVGATRYSNQRSAERYLAEVEAGRLPAAKEEPLDGETLFRERVAMGLRLCGGLELEALCASAGQSWEPRRAQVELLVAHGLVAREGARVRLTPRGFDLHSAISARLM